MRNYSPLDIKRIFRFSKRTQFVDGWRFVLCRLIRYKGEPMWEPITFFQTYDSLGYHKVVGFSKRKLEKKSVGFGRYYLFQEGDLE